MTPETFQIYFPLTAARMAIGFTTTVEYGGRVYSFKKIGVGEFVRVNVQE